MLKRLIMPRLFVLNLILKDVWISEFEKFYSIFDIKNFLFQLC